MQSINRTNAPIFKTVESIHFIAPKKMQLSNDIPVYLINSGAQELIKIEFVFSAGIKHQNDPLVATTTNKTIIEGTQKKTARQIADEVDYYGAYLETDIGVDSASVLVYTLNKHLQKIMPIVEDVIKNASFPNEDVHTYLENKKAEFLVNQEKVSSIARKKMIELLLGPSHPYGMPVEQRTFDEVTTQQLQLFYQQYYNANNCFIIVSGKVDHLVVETLQKYFGGNDWINKAIVKFPSLSIGTSTVKKIFIPKEDAIQSAIKIGKLSFNRKHAQYPQMQLLTTILGGYFGSRLMSNIREDKGYTYGISSSLVSMQDTGYFIISTEVGSTVCQKALDEIYSEIEKLRNELISIEELQRVKNYYLGVFLKSVDGAFAQAERLKTLIEYDLDQSYYENYLQAIKKTTPKELLELAQQHLDPEPMVELVVGKK